jgi:hypothetical protein
VHHCYEARTTPSQFVVLLKLAPPVCAIDAVLMLSTLIAMMSWRTYQAAESLDRRLTLKIRMSPARRRVDILPMRQTPVLNFLNKLNAWPGLASALLRRYRA